MPKRGKQYRNAISGLDLTKLYELGEGVESGSILIVAVLVAEGQRIEPGQAVTFTATVTPASGGGTPGGTVQFSAGGVPLGPAVGLASGTTSVIAATTTAPTAASQRQSANRRVTAPPSARRRWRMAAAMIAGG